MVDIRDTMPNDALSLFLAALQRMTMRPPNDPDLVELARILRDAAPPINDLIMHGEGVVQLHYDKGRLLFTAHTPNYNVTERVD